MRDTRPVAAIGGKACVEQPGGEERRDDVAGHESRDRYRFQHDADHEKDQRDHAE